MALRDSINSGIRAIQRAGRTALGIKAQTKRHRSDFSRGLILSSGHEHPLARILDEARIEEISENPRKYLELYRTMWISLPFVQRSTVLKSVLAGDIKIETGNDATDRVLNTDLVEGIPIFNKSNSQRPRGNGLGQFYRTMRVVRDRDGVAFAEERYADEGTGPFVGLNIYDPYEFDYIDQGKTEILRWNHGGFSRDVEPSPFFIEYQRHFMPDISWSLPAIHGNELYATTIIRSMLANTNARVRFGNPLGMTFLQFKADELVGYAGVADEDPDTIVEAVKDDLAKAIKKGLRSLDTQRPQEIVAAIPSGDVRHEVYGKGVTPMPGYLEELQHYSVQILSNMGVPPELAGFILGGGGMGSDRYQIVRGLLSAEIEAEQKEDKPHIIQNALNMAADRRLRLRREDINVIRTEPDTADKKVQAEAEKITAEVAAMHLEQLNQMNALGLPEQAIDEYAEEIGRETWIVAEPTIPSDPVDEE